MALAVRISSMVVRVAALGVIILGFTLWSGKADGLQGLHMFFGIVVVLGLWGFGIAQATQGGSPVMAVIAVALGAFAWWFGANQKTFDTGSGHWLIQVIHFLIGLAAIGLVEVNGARLARAAK